MSDDVTADLIRALIENMRGARDDWASLAMVIDLSGKRISATHGYLLARGDDLGGGISPVRIRPPADAYLETRYKPRQLPSNPRAVPPRLGEVRGDIRGGRCGALESDPGEYRQINEQLRPNFG